ncbi:hypothetical protein JL722_7732 [Aureococcus anophagefferens]|nr:hypothetical protein JL722_7732 [Aureococcus anophagefferens]
MSVPPLSPADAARRASRARRRRGAVAVSRAPTARRRLDAEAYGGFVPDDRLRSDPAVTSAARRPRRIRNISRSSRPRPRREATSAAARASTSASAAPSSKVQAASTAPRRRAGRRGRQRRVRVRPRGRRAAVDAACASTLVALAVALRNESDALVLGVNAILAPRLHRAYGAAGMLSASGRCRAFDRRASGFVRAEGFGAVAVAAAGRGVDFCRTAHGGRAASLTAPRVARRSRSSAGAARRWTALEAHGTGTPLGDPIEVAAVCAVVDRRARSDADELGRVGHRVRGPDRRRAFAVVVGSGVSGLAFARALHHYAAVVVLEREAHVGGVWRSQANETSRVNTSEAAYRCHDAGAGDDADHTPACDILANLRRVAATYGTFLFRSPAVACRGAAGDHAVLVGPSRRVVAAALVCVCANRRLGRLRRLAFPSEGAFRGRVAYGAGDDARASTSAAVVVVGAGAFATENARTALEGGAARVAVVQRRRGSVCPRIVDYLNFSRPYDGAFAHRAEGNRLVFAAWKGAFAACGVTEPECWRAGRLAPAGHTISVSDVWLVAHACGSLSTALGRFGGVGPDAVTVGAASIPCTVILKCVGFWKNAALRRLLGANGLDANNVVRRGLCYQAEAILDNVGGYQSPSGSSYVEGAQLSILLLTAQLRDAARSRRGRLDAVDARASEGLLGLGTSPGAVAALGPRFLEAARARVLRRCLAFHETALPAASSPKTRATGARSSRSAAARRKRTPLHRSWTASPASGSTRRSRSARPRASGRRRRTSPRGSALGRGRRDGADERRAAPSRAARRARDRRRVLRRLRPRHGRRADAPLLGRARLAGATVFAETLALEASVDVPATIVFDAPSPSAVLRFLSPPRTTTGRRSSSRSTAAIARAVLRFPGGRLVLGLVAAVAVASTHSPRPTSASYGAFLRASFGAATLGRVEASTVDVRQLALLDVAGALGPPRSAGVYVAALGFTRPRGGEALEPNAHSSTGDLLSVAAGRVRPCPRARGRGPRVPRGRCHAFDGRADGYCRADGLAAYLLGGDGPDDVPGVEARHDGGSASLAAPNGSSQRRLLRSVDGATIALEAHGTGTALGDPVEVGAPSTRSARRAAAVKGVAGHAEACAAAAAWRRSSARPSGAGPRAERRAPVAERLRAAR